MNYFKFNILTFLFVGLIGFVTVFSCNDDDEIRNDANHRVIYTSEMDFDNIIEVNNEITFGDTSVGVKSRTWTFPDNVVNIEGSNNNITSSEAVVKAYFNTAGEYDVVLNQIFNGNAYVNKELKGNELDTIIKVTVLEPVSIDLKAYILNSDGTLGNELTLATNAENEVMASKTVRFVHTTSGAPNQFEWTFERGNPSTYNGVETEVDVKYSSVGVYDVQFKASRNRPFGESILTYENLIKVIPSTAPVTLDKVTDNDGKIALEFSRDMNASSIDPNTFSITINNNGTTLNPSVLNASLSPNAANVILLELSGERVYNDDEVLVSYTPGSLMTQDAVAAVAFTDVPLEFTTMNILETTNYDYSFENSSDSNWPYLWWGAPWDKYDLAISSNQAHHGSKSAYVEIHENGGMIIGHSDQGGVSVTFPAKSGKTYEIGVWVYVEDLGDQTSNPDLRFFWDPNTNWGVTANPEFTTDFAVGEWVYSSVFAEFTATGDYSFWIRGWNEYNAERLKFYMDNISISEVNLRP